MSKRRSHVQRLPHVSSRKTEPALNTWRPDKRLGQQASEIEGMKPRDKPRSYQDTSIISRAPTTVPKLIKTANSPHKEANQMSRVGIVKVVGIVKTQSADSVQPPSITPTQLGKTANGDLINIPSAYVIEFTLGDDRFTEEFAYLPRQSSDVVLGMDFLGKRCFPLDLKNHAPYLDGRLLLPSPSETKETLVPSEAPLPDAAPSAAPTPTEPQPKLTLADRLDKYRTHLEWPTDIRLEIQRRRPIGVPRHCKFRMILPPADGGPRWVTIPQDTPKASRSQCQRRISRR